MIYPFIKRALPILIIGLIIYIVLFVGYVGIFQATSMMIDRQAHEIKVQSTDDVDFANNVRVWVWGHVTPKPPYHEDTNAIQPPEISYLVGAGDCSERSLLMTKMLTDEGMDAHTIWGAVGTERHQSVEYTVNGTTRIIDQEQFPEFRKEGDGVQSIEYVYDAYWFIPWRNMVNNQPTPISNEIRNETQGKVYMRLQ
jgi:hypothetical protein